MSETLQSLSIMLVAVGVILNSIAIVYLVRR